MNDLSDLLYQVFLTVVWWEGMRMMVKNLRLSYWEADKDDMMEECQMCFKKVPNIEFHRPRCKNKPRITGYYGSSQAEASSES